MKKQFPIFIVFLVGFLVACGGRESAVPAVVPNVQDEIMQEAVDLASETADNLRQASSFLPTKLNLNSTTSERLLATIPNLSPEFADVIAVNQPFATIQDFRNALGGVASDSELAIIEQFVFVPIDVNASDMDTLVQLPGVDEAVAEILIALRPFESNNAFLNALSTLLSDVDLELAESYLQ